MSELVMYCNVYNSVSIKLLPVLRRRRFQIWRPLCMTFACHLTQRDECQRRRGVEHWHVASKVGKVCHVPIYRTQLGIKMIIK